MNENLIFDIGMHTGVDTEYYLDLGYSVVALEANPSLVEAAKIKFRSSLSSGRLSIENVGINNKHGEFSFYVNKFDEWSSFNESLGTRGGEYTIMPIRCVRLGDLLSKYGMPFFLKIDVEGVDELVVRDLMLTEARPKYVSLEDAGIECLIALYESGVRQFKFLNQPEAHKQLRLDRSGRPLDPPRPFGVSSSGPFGDNLPGPWLDVHQAFQRYSTNIRPPGQAPIDGWWDIHGCYET